MDAGDSAFFAWRSAWTVHALKTDPSQLPHANTFHPLRYTLGMDEPVLGTTVLVLPLALFTDDAVLLYKRRPLLTFLSRRSRPAWREGACAWGRNRALPEPSPERSFAFSPIRTDQVAHLSTLGTQWWPLALLFTIRSREGAGAKTPSSPRSSSSSPSWRAATTGDRRRGAAAFLLVLFWVGGAGRRPEYWRRPGGSGAPARLPDAPESPRPRALRAGAERRSCTRAAVESFLSTSAWNRVYGEATDAFRTVGRTTCSRACWCRLVLAGVIAVRRSRERPSRRPSPSPRCCWRSARALGPRVRAFGYDSAGPWPSCATRSRSSDDPGHEPGGVFLACVDDARRDGSWRGSGPAHGAGRDRRARARETVIAPIPMRGGAS